MTRGPDTRDIGAGMNLRVDMDEALAKMEKLTAYQMPKFRNNVLNDLAREAVKVMTPIAPRDTGRLQDSINIYTPGKGTIEVGPSVRYAAYVALGHFTRGGGRWIPGQPFHTRTLKEIIARAPTIMFQHAKEMVGV